MVYQDPRYDSNDNLLGTFHRIGGPVNVSGGWFDAGGGYEKFAYTASYADGLLLLAARDFPGSYPTLRRRPGSACAGWRSCGARPRRCSTSRWASATATRATRSRATTTSGSCRRPRTAWTSSRGGNPGPSAYYVKYRPVFEAAPPGAKISPEFAGRFAADFALGAQLAAATARHHAEHLLSLARGIYAMAQTSHVGSIVTTFPHDYYPGTEWKSAMLWGAAEIALADEALRRAGRAGAGRPGRGGALGPGLHRAGPPGRRGHAEPLRQRRDRRGRTAPGDARGARDAGHRAARAAGRHGRATAGGGGPGARATRSASASRSARATPRRTRSAWPSPTRCTSTTAGPPPTGRSPRSS